MSYLLDLFSLFLVYNYWEFPHVPADPHRKSNWMKMTWRLQLLKANLDHSKAENYPWPGVYLHVVYDKNNHGVFWLYVGAGMDVKNRIFQHNKVPIYP